MAGSRWGRQESTEARILAEAKAEPSLDFRGRGRVRKNGRVWPRPRPIFWILYPIPLSLKMLPTIFRWSTHDTISLGKFYLVFKYHVSC